MTSKLIKVPMAMLIEIRQLEYVQWEVGSKFRLEVNQALASGKKKGQPGIVHNLNPSFTAPFTFHVTFFSASHPVTEFQYAVQNLLQWKFSSHMFRKTGKAARSTVTSTKLLGVQLIFESPGAVAPVSATAHAPQSPALRGPRNLAWRFFTDQDSQLFHQF